MKEYPAKTAYQSEKSVEEYDIKRFHSLRGKIIDYLEKRAFSNCLKECTDINSLLDVPTGTGRFAEYLLKKYNFKISVADISQKMIDYSERRLNRFHNFERATIGDITNLPFESNSFDMVICVRLMGHLPDEVKIEAIRELTRISKHYIGIAFYEKSIWLSIKKKVVLFLNKNKSRWFPIKKETIKILLKEQRLVLITRNYVFRFFSECVFYLAEKKN